MGNRNRQLKGRASVFGLAALLGAGFLCSATSIMAEDGGPLFSLIDNLFAGEMREAGIPCAAFALTRNGEVVYAKGYGEARPGISADEDTPFYIGSITKSMTALAVMRLVEEGKVDLMAPATAYIPEFKMADPRFASIRVHDLLRQSSGLSTAQGVSYLGLAPSVTMGDLIARLSSARLASEPGSRYEYSNYNYVLLGEIVERVSGLPYAAYMKARVFEPLGMARTTASRAEAVGEGLAIGGRGPQGPSRLPGGRRPRGLRGLLGPRHGGLPRLHAEARNRPRRDALDLAGGLRAHDDEAIDRRGIRLWMGHFA
jgi:CubicO group peptidase (beta-lactamase class C family)